MSLAAIASWMPLIVAQMEHAPRRVSYLYWVFNALGWTYALALLLAGLVVFVGALVVVITARRPAVIAAYLVFVPLPLAIGVIGTIDGLIRSYSVIAMSTTMPNPAEVADGYSTALVSALVGLMATAPAYLITAIGLFFRTLQNDPRSEK